MTATIELDPPSLSDRHRKVRSMTTRLCEPLEIEDYQLQSIADCSPPKWHLAHTTWFFETFLLAEFEPNFQPHHPHYRFLFNSYYDAVGDRWPRAARGLLSRPTVREVMTYRKAVDDRVERILSDLKSERLPQIAAILEIGWNHEQQHQELLLADLKHALGHNPLRPAYQPDSSQRPRAIANHLNRHSIVTEMKTGDGWVAFPSGIRLIGGYGSGFTFDNENPRHKCHVPAFRIARNLVTCGDYLEFMNDGGYKCPQHWLSDGWAACRSAGWNGPLYWEQDSSGQWSIFTLSGLKPLTMNEPVCHVSYYEADAFARWAGYRLPTEVEWETAATSEKADMSASNFLESEKLHPDFSSYKAGFFGNVWQWTCSPYVAYPGYRPASGAIGEYNGKFMCNQYVLRGGACVTPIDHIRSTYRNFYPPDARHPFAGLRLAEDLPE